jgi:N6-adenosine-specific RNA methylase IME4
VRCLVCDNPFLAIRRSAKTCSDACRQTLSRFRRASTLPLPSGPFDLILADPPWHFSTYSEKGQGRSASRHYATMSVDRICKLPIKSVSAEDAGLALWVYGPLLREGLNVMKSWGYEYKSDLITWEKVTSSGEPAFGTGYYTRKSTEQLLFGTKGRGLTRIDRSVPQCIRAPRREHSRKPDEVYDALERLFGPVRRLELFARQQRDGWDAWGNEIAPRVVVPG